MAANAQLHQDSLEREIPAGAGTETDVDQRKCARAQVTLPLTADVLASDIPGRVTPRTSQKMLWSAHVMA